MCEPTDDIIERLLAERARIIAEATPGTDAARQLAAVSDEAVSALAEAAFASCSTRWAVIPLGAYGSRRLLPYSDIDLLVLSEATDRRIKPYVERLLYPLWDAGLEVGHQVRSRSEHIRQCGANVEILTASLTGRVLAGNATYGAAVLAEVIRRAQRRRRQVAATLALRERPGSPYLLESDLKDGAGGQRDIDELVWRTAITKGSPVHDVRELEIPDWPTSDGLEHLATAQDMLTVARWRVQTALHRKSSRLTLDIADGIASPALHNAQATVDMLLVSARDVHDVRGPWDIERLFSALAEGTSALPALERAAFRGDLDVLIKGMSDLMVLRRPGRGHRYTVGAHMLRTAATVAILAEEDPLTAQALTILGDTRPLLTAALTHDAGKATPGPGHAQRGVPSATALARIAGLDEDGIATVEQLVREHLLLAETAATADTQDDDDVLDVASRVGDVRTLGALYVLTAADSMATGPGAWTRWHAALVGSLLAAVDAVLTEPDATTIASRAQLVRIEALESLPSGSPLSHVVRAMSYRYLVDRSPASVIAEASLVNSVASAGSGLLLATRVALGPVADSYRITVAVPDRNEIFSTVAGCLTLAGLDIIDAEAHSVLHVALDSFVVTSATSANIEHHTWNRFERELHAALTGNLALETRLEERRSHYANGECDVPVDVESDTDSSRVTTVCVTAPDRIGLLHDIAAEVAQAGLTIVRARALVRDGIAYDVFFLTDGEGQPPSDPGVLGHLAMNIREHCS